MIGLDPRQFTPEALEEHRLMANLTSDVAAKVTRTPLADGMGMVYSYTSPGCGAPAALAFTGKSTKAAWHFRFASEERREARIRELARSLEARQQRRTERAQARKAFRHTLQVGDVLVSSWGWEQTNVDHFQVVKTSASCVWLRKIASSEVDATGPMSGHCVPVPDHFVSDTMTQHRVQEGNGVRLTSYSSARPCAFSERDGVKHYRPSYWSSYA